MKAAKETSNKQQLLVPHYDTAAPSRCFSLSLVSSLSLSLSLFSFFFNFLKNLKYFPRLMNLIYWKYWNRVTKITVSRYVIEWKNTSDQKNPKRERRRRERERERERERRAERETARKFWVFKISAPHCGRWKYVQEPGELLRAVTLPFSLSFRQSLSSSSSSSSFHLFWDHLSLSLSLFLWSF